MTMKRRTFVQSTAASAAFAATTPTQADNSLPRGRAESCIFIWLGGGACHIDTWDPKRVGDPTQGKAKPGSAYPAIDTAIPGVQVCEHLRKTADRLDRGILLRTVNHDVIDEHAAATNRLHTGRPPTGTTIYPSIGAVVSHERGSATDEVPAYIVMGYPSATRGPGFLGAKHNYIYLTDTASGPAGLRRPDDVTPDRLARRQQLLTETRSRYRRRFSGFRNVEDYIDAGVSGDNLAGARFAGAFDLSSENDNLRNAYGGEFGQRCLLARRLAENGVRFSEVSFNLNFINGTGWDTHNDGQLNQHILIQQLDQSLAALIDDLELRGLLDSTLVVVATEFGRPPEFDGGGGRGHHSKAFTVALFGGGLKTGQAIGTTDELGREIVDTPVSVADLHATIYTALGVDPHKELFDGDRPVPITDHGQPVLTAFG